MLDVRKLDVLQALLLTEDPLLPFRASIGHASEDDLRDLKARLAEAHCPRSR